MWRGAAQAFDAPAYTCAGAPLGSADQHGRIAVHCFRFWVRLGLPITKGLKCALQVSARAAAAGQRRGGAAGFDQPFFPNA